MSNNPSQFNANYAANEINKLNYGLQQAQETVVTLKKRIKTALRVLEGMIDGDSPMDGEISDVIRILDGTQP
jgi:hypothetical protein